VEDPGNVTQGNSLFPVKPFLVSFDFTGRPAMGRIDKTVFISYRRTNAFGALAIFQDLTHHGYDVFFDYNGIPSGDFETVILENVRARAHFLVLLTPSALDRCSEPEDWLRREIETALDEKRNIIPLMLEGFSFGTPAIADQLTGKLALLRKYQALSVPVEYFVEAMDRLRTRYLDIALDAVSHPASVPAQEAAMAQQAAASTAPVVREEKLSAQTHFERGFAATSPNEKIRFYTEAIRLQPAFPEAYNNRAIAYQAKGEIAEALADLDEAIRFKPTYATAYYNRGITRYDKGDLAGALKDYDEAIRLQPGYLDVGHEAENPGDDGENAKATTAIEAAIDEVMPERPNYGIAYNNRGLARSDKGDVRGALADFNEALRLMPNLAAAWFNRANLYYDKGDFDRALADYDQALRLRSRHTIALNNRGLTRKALGDIAGAIADYDAVIELKPNVPDTYYNRAQARRVNAQYAAAIADLEKYLELRGGEVNENRAEVTKMIRELKAKL
jgi:tetratricopeptide (TPR) repeat protein